jgi:iron complex transport system ATP-binding protein
MTPLVEFAGVGFAYPRGEEARGRPFALDDVTFAIEPGHVLGVIGPNSAGKTTLIRLLTRVVTPHRGEIRLRGTPLARLPRWDLARQVAVVAQDVPPALPFTVEQLVLMGRYPHAPRRYFETAADLAIAREAMALTDVLELAGAPMPALSGGERQRAVLARALAQQPRLLVLDEPTAHLDLRYQAECVALLRRAQAERGMTILLVSHDVNLAAEVSDRLLLLDAGRVAGWGPPADVLEPALLSRVYGCAVAVEGTAAGSRPRIDVLWPRGPAAGRR